MSAHTFDVTLERQVGEVSYTRWLPNTLLPEDAVAGTVVREGGTVYVLKRRVPAPHSRSRYLLEPNYKGAYDVIELLDKE